MRGIDPHLRGVGPNTAVAWGSIAGWRSGPCRGCTAFAGSGCGPIERVRSMMPSSRWLQLSYVCGSYDKVFLLGALKKYIAAVEDRGLLVDFRPGSHEVHREVGKWNNDRRRG